MFRPLRLAAAALCSLVPLAAHAQATVEQAELMRQQLSTWLTTTFSLGPGFLNDLFRIAPEGEHYRLALRLDTLPGLTGVHGGNMSVALRALPGGRWLLYDLRFASPFSIRTELPGAASGGTPATAQFSIRFGNLNWEAVLDPSFATPSVLGTTIAGYDVDASGPNMQQRTHIDALSGQASLIPLGGGRVDVRDAASADDFGILAEAPEQQPSVAVLLGRVEASGKIAGLDRERLWSLIHTLSAAVSQAQTPNAPSGSAGSAAAMAKMDRGSVRELYLKLRGIATGAEFNETLEDIRADGGGHVVDIGRFALGGGVETPDGTLRAHLLFAIDSVTSPEIPPPIRGYVPRHVLIRPTLSGINLADLDALVMAAIASEHEPSMQDPQIAERVNALFAHGGITAGLDALEIDVGSTHLGATGHVTALAPDRVKGEADVTVIGWDALVAHVQRSHEWWGRVAPFLQLLGMLGRHEGERIVWTITAENTDVRVNGLDIPALIAAGHELERH